LYLPPRNIKQAVLCFCDPLDRCLKALLLGFSVHMLFDIRLQPDLCFPFCVLVSLYCTGARKL
jgi:hypothetical protein